MDNDLIVRKGWKDTVLGTGNAAANPLKPGVIPVSHANQSIALFVGQWPLRDQMEIVYINRALTGKPVRRERMEVEVTRLDVNGSNVVEFGHVMEHHLRMIELGNKAIKGKQMKDVDFREK